MGFFQLTPLSRLTKILILLLGIIIVFYAGYELAIFQTQKNYTLLPHINFTSNSSGGNCPDGETPGYTPLPNATQETCLRPGALYEPVIYLYPTHQENVHVKVSYPGGFSETIPAYNAQTGWQVSAQPDGTLTNQSDGKTYPYLVWEGNPDPSLLHFDMSKGFVVSGNDTQKFLQQQLPAMGLNQSETTAFIAFWLPKLAHNPYNLIHFSGSEYTNAAKLSVSPKPDSVLRVFMAFKPLSHPSKVTPQSLAPFQRHGFTVIEWGGTEVTE
ncbi:MAG TPA: hypothetical protein VHB72_01065 [Candidatus Saccharimonadales bacterium]|nr:hypothetical protein [Candidatus Saccharimonadales bacterium]